jgi:hypothetical protein
MNYLINVINFFAHCPVDNIQTLAFELACDSIKLYEDGRAARHQAPDIPTIILIPNHEINATALLAGLALLAVP